MRAQKLVLITVIASASVVVVLASRGPLARFFVALILAWLIILPSPLVSLAHWCHHLKVVSRSLHPVVSAGVSIMWFVKQQRASDRGFCRCMRARQEHSTVSFAVVVAIWRKDITVVSPLAHSVIMCCANEQEQEER